MKHPRTNKKMWWEEYMYEEMMHENKSVFDKIMDFVKVVAVFIAIVLFIIMMCFARFIDLSVQKNHELSSPVKQSCVKVEQCQ